MLSQLNRKLVPQILPREILVLGRCRLASDEWRLSVQLPEDLAALCDELKSKTVAEISRESGVPETTMWDRVALIRPYFEAQAIEDYL